MKSRTSARLRSWAALLATSALAICGVVAGSAASATAATDAAACVVEDASITWGFKESFRSYISGSIAHGEWTVSDGARYETPEFRFSDGSGAYDGQADEGAVAFDGAITFTGHGGILATTIANPVLEFENSSTAYLVADISGTTQDGEEVDASGVRLVSLDLGAAADRQRTSETLSLSGVPTTLTDAGAAAFGTYPAGEAFDPLAFELGFDGECDHPAGDLGWVAWVGASLVLLVGIVAAVLVVRRRSNG